MARLKVIRFKSGKDATLSKIYLDGEMLCHGLEDEYRAEKVEKETRTPPGTYPVALRTVGGFNANYIDKIPGHIGMIWIKHVPDFKYILWHIGNFEYNTDGCLLLGQGDTEAMSVWRSSDTYKRVYGILAPMIRDGEITEVEYIDHDYHDRLRAA